MKARLLHPSFDIRLAASAWLLGLDTAKIGWIVGVAEPVIYHRIDEIRALARAMRQPPPDGGQRRAA